MTSTFYLFFPVKKCVDAFCASIDSLFFCICYDKTRKMTEMFWMIHRSIPDFVFITVSINMNNKNHDETNDTAGVDKENAEVIEDRIKQGIARTVASESILTQPSTVIDEFRGNASQISDDRNKRSVSINSVKSPTKKKYGKNIINSLLSCYTNLCSSNHPSTSLSHKRKERPKTTNKKR
jgi:hypothetical protein